MKKFLFLVYGLIAYSIFFFTFSYAVGFVSTMIVPKHIDSAPQSSLGYALLVNAGLLSLFAIQHSVMARPAFKKWWTKYVPEPIERSTYVLLASLCLLFMFWQWQPVGGIIWQVKSAAWQVVLKAVCLAGFSIVLVSTFLINHFDLFGLRQVWAYFTGKKYEHLKFRTPFFYRYVRHPLYLGFMIAFWSTPVMTATHLFFAIMTTLYMLTAIRFEENDLVKQFGEKYRSYKRSAPMLIPFTKSSGKAKTKPVQKEQPASTRTMETI